MKRYLVLAGMMLALASGCTTSKQDFETAQVALEGSPIFRKQVTADCIKKNSNWPASERAQTAALMNIPVQGVERVFCQRVTNAYANGRISYQDYLDAARGIGNANLIRVLQGRR